MQQKPTREPEPSQEENLAAAQVAGLDAVEEACDGGFSPLTSASYGKRIAELEAENEGLRKALTDIVAVKDDPLVRSDADRFFLANRIAKVARAALEADHA